MKFCECIGSFSRRSGREGTIIVRLLLTDDERDFGDGVEVTDSDHVVA